ncbi:MAG: STAS domain-containing protein [Acetobacteraceae bacterium]|nr:STAS domain-containing protein [Acetobacteraceae bacterium]
MERVVADDADGLLARWQELVAASGAAGPGRIRDGEMQKQCQAFLTALIEGVRSGASTVSEPAFAPARAVLDDLSKASAASGFGPRETATFVFSIKQPLFERIRSKAGDDAAQTAAACWQLTELIDQFGLYMVDVHQRIREEVVRRQREEIAELSTPVVKLWDGILALPLIGTLDSSRTQVVMENLLQAIVDQNAELAIIDITGVPTVDTLVAQHLLKTIAAARLMGADCIISGIRPQIAQTMVHLGVELDVVSKATLADALAQAFARTGRTVTRRPALSR